MGLVLLRLALLAPVRQYANIRFGPRHKGREGSGRGLGASPNPEGALGSPPFPTERGAFTRLRRELGGHLGGRPGDSRGLRRRFGSAVRRRGLGSSGVRPRTFVLVKHLGCVALPTTVREQDAPLAHVKTCS